jgi:hypothetical protein
MAYVDGKLSAKRLVTCSCDWGCPCEFLAPPTKGHCEGVEGWDIVEGYFDKVRLDGLRFAGIYQWPGPVHEGNGSYQVVIDARATEEQLEALFKIMSGEEQEPTTLFNIYGATIETEYDPIFTQIDMTWDLENLTGRLAVDGVLEAKLEPIRNPVTGAVHRAILKLPDGFELREAVNVSGDYWAKSTLPMNGRKRFAYLTYASYGPYGVIEEESHPIARA